MKKLILYILFLFFIIQGFAQAPLNDNCSGATNLGTLPTPGNCGTGIKSGTTATSTGNITNATAENPYTTLSGCGMAAPAKDVWYSFVAPAKGFGVNIVVSGATFTNPNIALWQGSTCSSLAGIGCIVGAGATATLNIPDGLLPGATYYIQISGNSATASGTFNLAVSAFQDCSDCLDASHITVTPTPINGSYQPGESVSFCFHVDQWTNAGQNWFHGVQLYFGNGWDLTTLTTTTLTSINGCDGGLSNWAYYPSGITASSGTHYQAGFYFDGGCGNSISADGNPGNNFGDVSGTGNAGTVITPSSTQWNFCWTIKVKTGCNPGASLSLTVTTSGDGESGDWTSTGCANDAATNFNAVQACCPPIINVTNELCNGGSTGSATATAVVGAAGNQDPYVFAWTGGATATNTVTVGTSNNLPNLPAGNYTVTVTDKNLCAASTTVAITQPTAISATLTPVNATCLVKGSITTTASGGTSPYTYAWTGPSSYTSTAQSPATLIPGTYSLTITDHNNCTYTTTATVAQTGSITVTATSPTVCANGMATITAGGATSYSWTVGVTSSTGTVVTASPGTTTTSYTVTGTTGTCTNTAVSTVNVIANPTLTATSPTICVGKTATVTVTGNATAYSWTAGVTPTTGTVVTASPGTTTSYTITGTKGTCTNTAVSTVSVIPLPIVTVTSPTICANGTATITASGATTYSWTAGTTTSTGTVVTVNPGTATTSYTVTGTVGTCTNTAISTVSIIANPTLTVTSPTICAGSTATITATGNATSYSWTAGVAPTTGNVVTASPGAITSYTVIGTKGTCTNTAVSVVSITPKPSITINNASICSGGTATLTANGASTYTWSTSETTSGISVSPLITTSYTVNGTANSCTNTAISTVSVVSSLTVTINSPTICAGSAGVLTADGAATYTWSTGATTNTISVTPLTTSSYSVTGSAGTCSATATSTVTIAPNPTVTVTSPTVCANGTATITASGADSYNWTTGVTTSTGTVVTANPGTTTTSYTVTGTTGTCTNTAVSTVTVISNPTVTVNNPSICAGTTATLTAGGASTYTWSTSETNGSILVNPANTISYTVTGTANSCTNTAVSTVSVISNPTITVNNAAICIGQQTATLTANSNASSFSWSPAIGLSTTTDAIVTATPAISQTYTITGSAGTCTVSTTATVTVNTLPVISATSGTICLGQQTATLTANGAGTGTYSWDPSTGLSATSGSVVTGTPASTQNYTVTGTDANGCISTGTSSITVSPIPTVTVNNPSICSSNTVTLTAGGASTYSWSTSETTSTISVSPVNTTSYTVTGTTASCTNTAVSTVSVIGTPTLTVNSAVICIGQQIGNLTANSNASSFLWSPAIGLSTTTGNSVTATPITTQTYTIIGSAGTCTVSTTATVTVNSLPTITATSSTICLGQQTATLTASGAGTGTYNWDPPTGLSTISGSVVIGTPTSTQSYIIIGTDVNGCYNTGTANITVSPIPTVTVNNPSICATNTVTLTAGGASTYSWSTSQTTASISVSPVSTTSYTVTGTTTSCTNTSVSTVSVISNPTITVNNAAICKGQQTATLTAISNASSFTWSPATGLGATTGNVVTATPATAQTYTIIGSAGTCTVSTTATVNVNSLPVPIATANAPCETEQPLNLNCVVNPAGTYTYSWSGPNSYLTNTQSPIILLGNVTQAVAGTYTILVTDINACTNTATVNVTVHPTPIVTATGATVCVGQTFSLTSAGAGNPPNAGYHWTGPNNYNSALQNPSIVNSSTGMTGPYNVVGTDANGCYSGLSVQVTINALPVISVNSGTLCMGQQTTTLTASSTNAGTNYSWSPSTGLSASTGSNIVANPSQAGIYTYAVTGTDGNSCVGTNTATVLVNSLPTVVVSSAVICNGQQTATLTASGATTYSWSAGLSATSGSVVTGNPTTLSSYTVTGLDANNCYNTAISTITVNSVPILTANSGTICVGQSTATLTVSSTNAGTNYTWTPSAGLDNSVGATVVANPSPANNYTYMILGIDANNCVGTFTTTVLVNPLPNVVVVAAPAAICVGQQTSFLTASGATSYTWSPSTGLNSTKGTSVSAEPVKSQNYTVTATDINNCVNTASTSVTVNPLPIVKINPVASECIPFCTPIIASSSPAANSCIWDFNNGQTPSTSTLSIPSVTLTASACYSVSGTYPIKLTVTDINTCVNSGTGSVLAFSQPTADFDYGPQPVSILTPEVQFVNESSPGLTHYSWNFGDIYQPDTSSLINPTHNYSDVGTYYVTLTVSTNKGCSASVVKPVIINEDYALYVPNTFTPNGDGKNEFFLAVGEGIATFKMYIFDRWGLLIFYSEDITKGWDGTYQGKGPEILQQDVYVWKINATNFKNKAIQLAGTVNLLK